MTSHHSHSSQHPLDPLTPSEISQAVALTRQASIFHGNRAICFNAVHLLEPEKEIVLRFKTGDAIERQAFLIVLDKANNATYEVVVSLTRHAIDAIRVFRFS